MIQGGKNVPPESPFELKTDQQIAGKEKLCWS